MGLLLFWLFSYSIAAAIAASTIAEHQGRDHGKALVLGFFFSTTTLLAYIALGKTSEKQAEDARRLVELMEKEQ